MGTSHDSDSSKGLKQGRSLGSLVGGIARVILVLAAIGLLGVLIDAVLNLPRIAAFQLLGFAPLAFGVYLETRAIYVFWKIGEGTPHPGNPPQRLVTEGPYRYSRNPLYVARLLVLVGVSLVLGSVGILILGVLLFLFVHFVLLPREEMRLLARYDGSWLEYQRRVSRWVTLSRRDGDSVRQRRRRRQD